MYLVFTRIPGVSDLRQLLHSCYVFRVLINSLVNSQAQALWASFGFRFLFAHRSCTDRQSKI